MEVETYFHLVNAELHDRTGRRCRRLGQPVSRLRPFGPMPACPPTLRLFDRVTSTSTGVQLDVDAGRDADTDADPDSPRVLGVKAKETSSERKAKNLTDDRF